MTETNDYEKAMVHIEPAYESMRPLFIPEPRMMIAAMAMQGLLSSGDYTTAKIDRVMKLAVEYADALLTELNKPKNETDKEI